MRYLDNRGDKPPHQHCYHCWILLITQLAPRQWLHGLQSGRSWTWQVPGWQKFPVFDCPFHDPQIAISSRCEVEDFNSCVKSIEITFFMCSPAYDLMYVSVSVMWMPMCVCVTGPKACLRLLAGTRFAWIRMPTTSGEEEPQTPNFGVHNPSFWSQVVLNGTIGINGLASCWGCRRDTSLSWDGSWIWWFTSGVDLLDGWLYRSGTTCFDNMTMEHPSGNFRSHKTIKHDWAVWLWGRISASLPLSDLGSVWYFHGASRKLHWFADTRACRVWKVLVPSTLYQPSWCRLYLRFIVVFFVTMLDACNFHCEICEKRCLTSTHFLSSSMRAQCRTHGARLGLLFCTGRSTWRRHQGRSQGILGWQFIASPGSVDLIREIAVGYREVLWATVVLSFSYCFWASQYDPWPLNAIGTGIQRLWPAMACARPRQLQRQNGFDHLEGGKIVGSSPDQIWYILRKHEKTEHPGHSNPFQALLFDALVCFTNVCYVLLCFSMF